MLSVMLTVVASIYGGAGGYTTGYTRMNNNSINAKMVTYGLSEINGVLLNGGSGYAFINKIIIGGSGYGGNIRKTNDSISVKYGIGGGYFEIGYMPLSFSPFSLFFMIGMGGYAEELVIGNTIRSANWDSVWQNFENETRISRGSFSVTPSLGFIIFSEKFPIGLMLEASYNTILSQKWKFDNNISLATNPQSPRGYFSFKLSILTGGIRYGK